MSSRTTPYTRSRGLSASTTSRARRRRPSTSNARPSTSYSTATTAGQRIICAVAEAKAMSPTVGLAFVNLDTSEGILCQISDSQTYTRTITKIAAKSPSMIMLPSTAVEPKSKLLAAIEDNFGGMRIEMICADRKRWSERVGNDYIVQLCISGSLSGLRMTIADNYYAVCCFAAVMKYVEIDLSLQWTLHSLRLRYESPEDTISIDAATVRSLELLENGYESRSKECLFGILNATQTPMGARLLRSHILQPLTSHEDLNSRWDAVEEFITSEELFQGATLALRNFLDADKVLANIVLIPREQTMHTTEQAVNHVLALKHFVSSIDAVYEAVSSAHSALLRGICKACTPRRFRHIQSMIDEVINPDTMYAQKPLDLRNQRNYAVKEGYSDLLEVARHTYKEADDEAHTSIRDLATEHDLALELRYDAARQYYIRLPVAELEDRRLDATFINVFRKGRYVECQTLALKKQNERISQSHQEVLMQGDKIIQGLLGCVREEVAALFETSESIGLLDMLLAFAKSTIEHSYVRPKIDEALAVKAARHPIKERQQVSRFIANDIFATQMRRFMIVTGCNMSGKSTYIRSVALICIMAQIGCFVPATIASVPMIKQILARVSTDDSIEANVSTFSEEMRDTAYILAHVDKDSLVIIDELGRGTSTTDGLAIALAISEALVNSRAMVWFATHFRDLARVMAERAGVASMHLSVDTSQRNIVAMLYQVAEGVEREEHYGLMVAKVLPFPPAVLDKAEQVAHALQQRAERNRTASPAIIAARRRRLVLELQEQLRQAHQGVMNDVVLGDWLRQLREDFLTRMMAIDRDAEMAEQSTTDGSVTGASHQGPDRDGWGVASSRSRTPARSEALSGMVFD